MRRIAPRTLEEILARFQSNLAPATTLARVQAKWETAVGTKVSAEAGPVSERAGVITVACESAVWAQELDLMSVDLLERVNAVLASDSGAHPVQSLRFIVART